MHRAYAIPERSLKFSLELKEAGSQTLINSICAKCTKRKDQGTWDIVDFRAETTIITVEDGAATIEFFIKSYASHHGLENFW